MKRSVVMMLLGLVVLMAMALGGCTVDAPLQSRPTLQVGIIGSGEGTVLVQGEEAADGQEFLCQPGVEVTLKAVPAAEAEFSGWSNGETALEIVVIMDQDRGLLAEFKNNGP